jgi:hypothetical protein
MLLQTNSYIVPKEKRSEHARLMRRFRQTLLRLGLDHFEVYEQVGANWSSAEAVSRFVQILRFVDRKHQLSVQAAERVDPTAQAVIAEFCDLINFPYQQEKGLFAVGFYNSVFPVTASRSAALDDADIDRGTAAEETAATDPAALWGIDPMTAAAVPEEVLFEPSGDGEAGEQTASTADQQMPVEDAVFEPAEAKLPQLPEPILHAEPTESELVSAVAGDPEPVAAEDDETPAVHSPHDSHALTEPAAEHGMPESAGGPLTDDFDIDALGELTPVDAGESNGLLEAELTADDEFSSDWEDSNGHVQNGHVENGHVENGHVESPHVTPSEGGHREPVEHPRGW